MTFVLSALTDHEVLQVSDRRFTYTQPGRKVTYDDEQNKAVLFCGRILFSFTGVGDLGMERQTDLWLAQRICDVITESDPGDQYSILRGVADKATGLFQQKLRYRGRRHAFIGVGWGRFGEQATDAPGKPHEFRPYLVLISNFHDDAGQELSKAANEFALFLRMLQDGEGYVLDVPNHLSHQDRDQLVVDLGAADRARNPEALIDVMAAQIKSVAQRVDEVGEGLMINRLPRSTLGNPPGHMVIAGGPLADTQTFIYVPPSGDTTVQLGPVTTCGQSIMSGFRAEPIPEGFTIPRPGPTLPDDPPDLIRRWYLTPVVGKGTMDAPFQAETLGRGGSSVLPSRDDGHPQHEVALVLVSSQDHDPLEADSRIYPIGDLVDLDRPVSDLDDTKRARIDAVTKLRQVPSAGSVRDVLRRIGQQLQDGFDESNYWAK